MTAFQQLAEFYERDPSIGVMQIDIAVHQELGYAYFSPDNLALARPVRTDWPVNWLESTAKTAALTDNPDCWYVWAAIGDLDFLLSLIPFPLPFIAFARRKQGSVSQIKFYNFERLYSHGRRSTSSTSQSATGICARSGSDTEERTPIA